MRYLFVCSLPLLLAGCDFIGGGDTIVKGNGNVVAKDEMADRVARALARFEATPEVTDEDIQALYGVIRAQAMAGELDAALVVLKVAQRQREPDEASDEADEPAAD